MRSLVHRSEAADRVTPVASVADHDRLPSTLNVTGSFGVARSMLALRSSVEPAVMVIRFSVRKVTENVLSLLSEPASFTCGAPAGGAASARPTLDAAAAGSLKAWPV